MRLSYTPNPPAPKDDIEAAIIERIHQRRGPSGLIALDRTQLHAPLMADGFNAYFKALRTQNGLLPNIRELCFCRVAALTGAWYEWDIHAPIAAEAGVTEDVLTELKKADEGFVKGLDGRGQAVVGYADAMTLRSKVEQPVFDRLKEFFDEKGVVELTNSIAGFNCVSRLVVALDVGEKNSE